MLRLLKGIAMLLIAIVLGVVIVVGGTNAYVVMSTQGHIVAAQEIAGIDLSSADVVAGDDTSATADASSAANAASNVAGETADISQDAIQKAGQLVEFHPDCILVLGASVLPDGTPSSILRDRLLVGAELYFAGIAPTILVSGDNGEESYNEVASMRAYLVELGVPSDVIVEDGAGFNTYDSMWRAHHVLGMERVVVVTQTYHEYRALFNAQSTGMKAWGVSSDLHEYVNQDFYDVREILARTKDVGQAIVGAKATVTGE